MGLTDGLDTFFKGYSKEDDLDIIIENDKNIRLARLFVYFRPKHEYFFTEPKSRLYSKEEISKILLKNNYGNSLEECVKITNEIISQKRLDFGTIVWAGSYEGLPIAVEIESYKKSEDDVKYKFKIVTSGSYP